MNGGEVGLTSVTSLFSTSLDGASAVDCLRPASKSGFGLLLVSSRGVSPLSDFIAEGLVELMVETGPSGLVASVLSCGAECCDGHIPGQFITPFYNGMAFVDVRRDCGFFDDSSKSRSHVLVSWS